MRKIAIVLGTRPEAVKLAPVILALRREPGLMPIVCNTAQHRQLLDPVLGVFGISPDADLDLMHPGQTLGELTARGVLALESWLAATRPDAVLVQGDTTTVLCAALAAFYQHRPLGHVEAGLRTGDLAAPYPEEANRVLTSRLATWHFAPTVSARENLLREGISDDAIEVTGNPVIDALLMVRAQLQRHPVSIAELDAPWFHDVTVPVVLITGHRRESFGAGFESICRAIARLAQMHPDVRFVYPVHLNPNVQTPVQAYLAGVRNVHLVAPQSYLPFVALLDRATVVLTDSGGVQEEAPSLGKPVLVMRDVTERPEAIAAGVARLVGTDEETIVREVDTLLVDRAAYDRMARAVNPYGDGTAAPRIVQALRRWLNVESPQARSHRSGQ